MAAEIPIKTHVQLFPLREANRALNALKNDAIPGRGGPAGVGKLAHNRSSLKSVGRPSASEIGTPFPLLVMSAQSPILFIVPRSAK